MDRPPLTPEQRTLRARLAAYAMHARYDARATTAAARAARWQKFLDGVDPAHELTDDERERRAHASETADMLALSLRSSQARRRRKRGKS